MLVMSLLLVSTCFYSLGQVFFYGNYIDKFTLNVRNIIMPNLFDKANQSICHPELAAKFVELEAKRNFMPLPGVSGS